MKPLKGTLTVQKVKGPLKTTLTIQKVKGPLQATQTVHKVNLKAMKKVTSSI